MENLSKAEVRKLPIDERNEMLDNLKQNVGKKKRVVRVKMTDEQRIEARRISSKLYYYKNRDVIAEKSRQRAQVKAQENKNESNDH